MSKDFSCRTCEHLREKGRIRLGEFIKWYVCEGFDDYNELYKIDIGSHFCARHTDVEMVKRIREGI